MNLSKAFKNFYYGNHYFCLFVTIYKQIAFQNGIFLIFNILVLEYLNLI